MQRYKGRASISAQCLPQPLMIIQDKFVEGTNINLKDYGFPTYDLIDFHTDVDIGLYVETIGGKFSEQKLNPEDFEGLLK